MAAQSGLEAGEESDAGACTHSPALKHVEGLDVAAQNNLSLQGLGLLSPLVASADDGSFPTASLALLLALLVQKYKY